MIAYVEKESVIADCSFDHGFEAPLTDDWLAAFFHCNKDSISVSLLHSIISAQPPVSTGDFL